MSLTVLLLGEVWKVCENLVKTRTFVGVGAAEVAMLAVSVAAKLVEIVEKIDSVVAGDVGGEGAGGFCHWGVPPRLALNRDMSMRPNWPKRKRLKSAGIKGCGR